MSQEQEISRLQIEIGALRREIGRRKVEIDKLKASINQLCDALVGIIEDAGHYPPNAPLRKLIEQKRRE
jgi:hypothetical protein